MPDHETNLNQHEIDLLEQVRQKLGVATIEEAAQWLAKQHYQQTAKRISNRGRALHLVGKGNSYEQK